MKLPKVQNDRPQQDFLLALREVDLGFANTKLTLFLD